MSKSIPILQLILCFTSLLLIQCGDSANPEEDIYATPDTLDVTDDVSPSPDTDTHADVHVEETPDMASTPDIEIQEPIGLNSWCEAAISGKAGERPLPLDIGRAHVGQRLFGPKADWMNSDNILTGLLDEEQWDQSDALESYAEASPDICYLQANSESAGSSNITVLGNLAVIEPGNDLPEIPADIEVVVIDLRNLLPGADVAGAVAMALDEEVSLGMRRSRRMNGFPAQSFGWTHYVSAIFQEPVLALATGEEALSLVFWTGPQLTPEAATLVAGLRMAGKAKIVGYHVYSAVAESTWSGLGEQGWLWRSSALEKDGALWPDVVSADIYTTTPENTLDAMGDIELTLLPDGPSKRGSMQPYDRSAGAHDSNMTRGTMRSILLTAYGTFDWFYPYFDLVGRDLDDALLQALEEVDSLESGDRKGFLLAFGRFMHDLYDGHGYYWDAGSTDWPDGYLLVQLHWENGEAMVRRSEHEGIFPGDTLTYIDGIPASEWFEEAMSRYSASSEGYRFVMAADELKQVYGTRELGLRAPDGAERMLSAPPASILETESVPWGGSFRENGWLDDLGAPNVYYINMSGSVTPDSEPLYPLMATLNDSDGLILDMRDYPNLDIYEFARYFNPAYFSAPLFGFPTWSGPEKFDMIFEAWEFDAGPTVFSGPVTLLVSNYSVSAAECFSQMIVTQDNVVVVGQQSASTNGTISELALPGQMVVNFTGMRLLNPDESEFHGIGIVPDILVSPTPAQFEAGIDPELDAAISYILSL